MINKRFSLAFLFLWCGSIAFGQSTFGPSDPSAPIDCGDYQWPEVQSPCPEVQIMQKHNHTPKPQYRHYGWDTVVDCTTPEGIVLSCMPYIPVKKFNGQYTVDQIPYNPPDTSFCLGTRMPISIDDEFASTHTTIPYPFFFFGIKKNQFRIGANGMVTFCSPSSFGSGNWCPYSVHTTNNKLPWNGTAGHKTPDQTETSNPYFDRMHDAIYGVYEDTDPRYFVGSDNNRVDGIYYGIQDQRPCRKIICSWKQAPDFSSHDNKATYQIVCYEGSNIIEVHIKRRSCCPSTSDACIGIQNATGNPQQNPGEEHVNDPNGSVITGSPAAFYPTGYTNANGSTVPFTNGTFSNVIDTIAFRFTPQGFTDIQYNWYRIFDVGHDSAVILPKYDPVSNPEARNDTNGWVTPMDRNSATCPSLTLAHINPSVPSKYVFELRFYDAVDTLYKLTDTIFVGVDKVDTLHLVKNSSEGVPQVYTICQGTTASMSLQMTDIQEIASDRWRVKRENNGERVELESSILNFGTPTTVDTVRTIPVTFNTANLPNAPRNKVDSIYISVGVDFTNGCINTDSILCCVYPNFDTTYKGGICDNESFTWYLSDTHGYDDSVTYDTPQDPSTTFFHLTSVPGCDSLVRLKLVVSTVTHHTDTINDCAPITWIDSITYEESNYTAIVDTLKNMYGCDSVVHLHFTLYPLTARLHSNVEYFTFDNLDAVLTDISINGSSRVWKLPSMPDQTTPTAYYSIPVELDSAEILLIESSEYGQCIDTAKIVLPLNKENFWMPNVFTPDNPNGNNLFGSVSAKTLYQEMLIYNRRGELVFRCEGVDCTWDGRDLRGNPCVQDSYVYIIRYNNEYQPKNTKVIKGTVTLLR